MNKKEEKAANLILDYITNEVFSTQLKELSECYIKFITGCVERDILEFKLKDMKDNYERR
jgi:hypothetical protein